MDFSWAKGIWNSILNLLPTSPFRSFIDSIPDLPGLAELNWFFPVGECLDVLTAWGVAIGIFYLYSVIMRWIKLIGD